MCMRMRVCVHMFTRTCANAYAQMLPFNLNAIRHVLLVTWHKTMCPSPCEERETSSKERDPC